MREFQQNSRAEKMVACTSWATLEMVTGDQILDISLV